MPWKPGTERNCRILARHERTRCHRESPRAGSPHLHRRRRAAAGVGTGVAGRAAVVQRQAGRRSASRRRSMPPATAGRRCRAQSDRTVIIGSHLDSVPNGGWLDGALGVMAGLEALADVQGSAAAGHAQGRRLGRRGRRAVRPQPARLVGRERQPEGQRGRTPRRQDRRDAGRCAARERRRAVAHARIAEVPEGDQRQGLSRAAHRAGAGARSR